jgi:hypothetical protein
MAGEAGEFLVIALGLPPRYPWRFVLCVLAIVWFPPTAPNHPGADYLDNWIPGADVEIKKRL